jgi:hypothetical protein
MFWFSLRGIYEKLNIIADARVCSPNPADADDAQFNSSKYPFLLNYRFFSSYNVGVQSVKNFRLKNWLFS